MGIGGCLEGECRSGGGGGDRSFEILHLFVGSPFVLDGRDYRSFGGLIGGFWGFGGVELSDVLE